MPPVIVSSQDGILSFGIMGNGEVAVTIAFAEGYKQVIFDDRIILYFPLQSFIPWLQQILAQFLLRK